MACELFCGNVLLYWGISWMTRRLVGLFTPQQGQFSHFQHLKHTLWLSFPLSLCLLLLFPCLSLLSWDADVRRRLRAWLLTELDCSAAQSEAVSNRPICLIPLWEMFNNKNEPRFLAVFETRSYISRVILYNPHHTVCMCWPHVSLGQGQRK